MSFYATSMGSPFAAGHTQSPLMTPTKNTSFMSGGGTPTPTRGGGGGFDTPTRGTPSRFNATATATNSSFNVNQLPTPEREASDRFIPDRGTQDYEMSHFYLTTKENGTPPSLLRNNSSSGMMGVNNGAQCDSDTVPAVCEEPYVSALSRTLFPENTQTTVLGLHNPNDGSGVNGQGGSQAMYSHEAARYDRSFGVIYNENRQRNFKSKSFRVIPQTPERILDAPELLDDFYLNLLDWSSRNVMTVALGNTVYLWDAENGGITQLYCCQERENIITSVCFHAEGTLLAIGTQDAEVQLWDTVEQKLVRTITGHTGRVGSLSWNGDVLASGSRDTTIKLHDIRDQNVSSSYTGHTQEVCGLRWSPNGTQLASGGNDNLLNIWDYRAPELVPCYEFRAHKAAIKAMSWNPVHHNLLVSGGGTADKTLKFWNTATGTLLHSVDTKSQVCGVLWSKAGNELVSSHGYVDNQLTLWKYPSLKRTTDLTGHNSRVLHLAMSPDGQMVVSAAGDETIRFWRCFGNETKQSSGTSMGTVTSPQATTPPRPSVPAYGGSAGRRSLQLDDTPSKTSDMGTADYLEDFR